MAGKDTGKIPVAKLVLEIAERVHMGDTVYKRLPKQEVSRKRNFSALTAPTIPTPRSKDAVDMNRTYGI